MVERSHTAGCSPQIYAPLRQMSEKTTDWFASKADGAMTAEYYGLSVELPGVVVGDLQIIAQNGTLTVQGEKRFDHTESDRTYFFSEREYGAFQRSFRLPPDAAADRIDAVFKNGVLKILAGIAGNVVSQRQHIARGRPSLTAIGKGGMNCRKQPFPRSRAPNRTEAPRASSFWGGIAKSATDTRPSTRAV